MSINPQPSLPSIARHPSSCPRKRASTFLLHNVALALTLALAALPARAQQFPQDATPGQCLPTPHIAPGDAPGGNVYNQNAGPQAQDAPNDTTATYPTIQPTTPDPIPNDATPQDHVTYAPFPFSGGINNPILSQSGAPETSSSNPKGC